MRTQKRGMSSIVATSLVITITILAGAMIGTFVVPFVQKNLERSTECSNYENYFSLETDILGPICYQSSSKNNYIVVEAMNDKSLEDGIVGFQLLLVQGASPSNPAGKAVSIGAKQSGSSDPNFQILGAISGQTTLPPKSGEILTYVYNDGEKYERAEISAIVGNGRVCERKSDIIKIVPCGNDRGA